MKFTKDEYEYGEALCAWNRLFEWIDNANNISNLDKMKLILLLDVIKPMIVKIDIPFELYSESWGRLMPRMILRLAGIIEKAEGKQNE